MKRTIAAGTAVLALAVLPVAAHGQDDVYAGYPVTLKGYEGSATTSVSYVGQIARQVLHDSLKKLAGKGTGTPDDALKATMLSYFEGKDAGRAIVAPASKGPFVVKQSGVDELSKGTNLAGKTYKGAVPGMPNNMTGAGAHRVLDRQGVGGGEGLRCGERLRLSAADLQVPARRSVLQPGGRQLPGREAARG